MILKSYTHVTFFLPVFESCSCGAPYLQMEWIFTCLVRRDFKGEERALVACSILCFSSKGTPVHHLILNTMFEMFPAFDGLCFVMPPSPT